MSNAARLVATVTDAVPNEATGLIIDMSDVAFMDSAGVRMLVELTKRLGWRDQELRLVMPDDARIRRVLTVSGFEGVAAVHGSLGSALAHLAKGESDRS